VNQLAQKAGFFLEQQTQTELDAVTANLKRIMQGLGDRTPVVVYSRKLGDIPPGTVDASLEALATGLPWQLRGIL
jgi:hypothetical protein